MKNILKFEWTLFLANEIFIKINVIKKKLNVYVVCITIINLLY